jgi:hypothetical protein
MHLYTEMTLQGKIKNLVYVTIRLDGRVLQGSRLLCYYQILVMVCSF